MQTLSQFKAIDNRCVQAGNRSSSNHQIILVLALAVAASAMLVIPNNRLNQSVAAAKALQELPSDNQSVNFPLFVESSDMTSTLLLNNTTGDERTVAVTIFNNAGVPFSLPAIALKPHGPTRFRLKDLLQNATGDFSSGNIQFTFYGPAAGVTGQVTIVDEKNRLSFESSMTMAAMFASTTLQGIVWLPDKGTKANVALTNTSTQEVTVRASSSDGPQIEPDTLTLRPRETRLIDLRPFVIRHRGQTAAALVSLDHSGLPGDVVTTAFSLNERTGFSSNLYFLDCSTAKSSRLAAAHFKFGSGDTKGNLRGRSFLAPLVLANVADSPTEVHIFVDYTVEGVASRIELKQISLAPRETREIELSKLLAKRGVRGLVDDAGLDVTYSGPAGTVIGRLTSFDTSKDYSFDVPVKDPLAGMKRVSGVYPWQLDDANSTVLHLKNTLDKQVYAIVQLRYEGGTYNLERIKLAPYQTVAVDLKQLRDSEKQDIRATVLPKDVTSGQLIWYEETVGSLIGRAEVVNVDAGVASSFSCGGPCPCPPNYGYAYLLPGSSVGPVGGTDSFTLLEGRSDPCDNVYGPFDRTYDASWTSSNSSVASIQGPGSIYCASLGNCNVTAQFFGIHYEPQELCEETLIPVSTPGGVTVAPLIRVESVTVKDAQIARNAGMTEVKVTITAFAGVEGTVVVEATVATNPDNVNIAVSGSPQGKEITGGSGQPITLTFGVAAASNNTVAGDVTFRGRVSSFTPSSNPPPDPAVVINPPEGLVSLVLRVR